MTRTTITNEHGSETMKATISLITAILIVTIIISIATFFSFGTETEEAQNPFTDPANVICPNCAPEYNWDDSELLCDNCIEDVFGPDYRGKLDAFADGFLESIEN